MPTFPWFSRKPGHSHTSRPSRQRGGAARLRAVLSRPALEELEGRVCPSNTYNYAVAAQTGVPINDAGGNPVGTLTAMSLSSLNDAGAIAFLGTYGNNGSSVV